MLEMISCSTQNYSLIYVLKTLQNYWNWDFFYTMVVQNETNWKILTIQTKAAIRKRQSRKMRPALQNFIIITNKAIIPLPLK